MTYDLDLSALASEASTLPEGVDPFLAPDGKRRGVRTYAAPDTSECVWDADGLAVPQLWQAARAKWDAMPLRTRKSLSEGYLLGLAKEQQRTERAHGGGKRFTTAYAIAWARAQGWKLVDSERYDPRTKRHHDLMLGVDALCDDGHGLVGVQGAGKSERAEHYRRFQTAGGVEVAQRRHIRVVYVEFVRGVKAPVGVEWWA